MTDRALVTGAGSGIGRAIALALARRGFLVALAGRNLTTLRLVAQEIHQSGGRAVTIQVDLSQPDQVASLIPVTQTTLEGTVDLLVNNAAIMPVGPHWLISEEILAHAMQVNLVAPLMLTRLLLPDLQAVAIRQSLKSRPPFKRGIIFIASQAALMPLPYNAIYSATKAGLDSFANALRFELKGSGLHLTTAYPPAAATLMTQPVYDNFTKVTPLAKYFKLADPQKIGERIIASFQKGDSEVHWHDFVSILVFLHRFAPGFSRFVLGTQRKFLAHIYTPPGQDENKK